jgi:hypothetical protein
MFVDLDDIVKQVPKPSADLYSCGCKDVSPSCYSLLYFSFLFLFSSTT